MPSRASYKASTAGRAQRDEHRGVHGGGYGSAPLGLWYHGLRDRLQGAHARANARWGHVRAPAGSGRLVWFKAGASERSVRLATELLGALRQRRLDVRLVLTFEEDFSHAVAGHLAGMKKIGLGFGPCDAPRAVRRILTRFSPLLGIVCIETPPGPNLLRAAARADVHVVTYNAAPVHGGEVEACYPLDPAMAEALRVEECCGYVAPPADPLSQLAEAQVEPSFRALIGGADTPTMAWMHFPDTDSTVAAVRRWRIDPLAAHSLLFVSAEGPSDQMEPSLAQAGAPVVRLSRWDRQAVAPGTVVLADERRWYPAVAVSADLIHLASAPREVLWQALAAGVPISFAPDTTPAVLAGDDGEQRAAGVSGWAVDADIASCLARWQTYRGRPPEARQMGDACRRRFWGERRRSAEVIEELLRRIYDW